MNNNINFYNCKYINSLDNNNTFNINYENNNFNSNNEIKNEFMYHESEFFDYDFFHDKENIKISNQYKDEKLQITSSELKILTKFDECKEMYERYKTKCEKVHFGNIIVNTLVWNCQRINLKLRRRDLKINFLKDVLNYNKIDIIYLIDVANFRQSTILNGYTKYDDGRNLLFVLNEIKDNFSVDRDNNIIVSDEINMIFTYLIPNSPNLKQIQKLRMYAAKGYKMFGDFNYDSNSKALNDIIKNFSGEDTLRCGLIGASPIKCISIDAPSDHYALLFITNEKVHHQFPLRLKQINVNETILDIKKVLKGDSNITLRPKVTIKQFKNKFNDSENLINKMLYEYVDNNVTMAYHRYNYLWKFTRKEPFLGTSVNDNIITTFAQHLKAQANKVYEDQIIINDKEICYFNLNSKILRTKSKALTYEYQELGTIANGVKEYCDFEIIIKKKKNVDDFNDYDIINNVLKIASQFKNHIRANTFFLVKNQKLENFNDVRMIIIIPTFIKIYELLIYDDVCKYIKNVIEKDGIYQFGGLSGGSCYDAIYTIRNKYIESESKALFVSDMTKGYDCVNLNMLKELFLQIDDRRIRYLLCNWLIMIKNLDYVMNNTVVKRSRGIGMGLSLSPSIFVFYCHKCYEGLSKDMFVQYIDDLTIIFPKEITANGAKDFIDNIIERFRKFDLIINKKKSIIVTKDSDFIEKFKDEFSIGTEDKFLGRELAINELGFLVGDDRFFSNKNLTIASFPNYHIEGIKKLILNGAILAKLRYRFMCWSTSSKFIRHRIFTSNFLIFKGKNKQFSYIQLILNMPNVFLFFVDAAEIDKFLNDIEKGKNEKMMDILFKNKLLTGIDIYDEAISKCKFTYKRYNAERLRNGVIFMTNIFEEIKKKVIEIYKKKKQEEERIEVYPNIESIINTKLYSNFRIIQNIVWKHNFISKNKTVFMLNFFNSIREKINKYKSNLIENSDIIDLTILDINFKEINIPKNYEDEAVWTKFTNNACKSIWPIIADLCTIELNSKNTKNDKKKNNFKKIFKLLTAAEVIINNNTFQDMSVEIMECIFKIKLANIDPLLENIYNIVNNDNLAIADMNLSFDH